MNITRTVVALITNASLGLLIAIRPSLAAGHDIDGVAASSSVSENTMISATYINPTEDALESMLKLPMDEPLYMLNMIRLKEKADYQEGNEFTAKDWTGAQAYAEYRRYAGAIVKRLGGKLIYEGTPQLTLIGPEQEQWDSIFIIYYPSVAVLKALSEDPEYQAHAFHRSAGVADSRLIRMASTTQVKLGSEN